MFDATDGSELALCVDEGVVSSAAEADTACLLGLGFRHGAADHCIGVSKSGLRATIKQLAKSFLTTGT